MESLAYIYLAIVLLVFVELVGFAIFNLTRAARRIWPFASLAITAAVIGTSIFELVFIGADSLFGKLFLVVPILLCVAISWISLARKSII